MPASNDANPFGKVTHNETKKYVYYDYFQKEILRTGTKQEALATIEKIKMQLMTGKTPWKP